jgi:hypothetical protein
MFVRLRLQLVKNIGSGCSSHHFLIYFRNNAKKLYVFIIFSCFLKTQIIISRFLNLTSNFFEEKIKVFKKFLFEFAYAESAHNFGSGKKLPRRRLCNTALFYVIFLFDQEGFNFLNYRSHAHIGTVLMPYAYFLSKSLWYE